MTTLRSDGVHWRRIKSEFRSTPLSRPERYPWIIVSALLLMLLIPRAGEARAEHLHGLVLALTPQTGTVVVRHDAVAGMPAMTMAFRVVPRERARELQVGSVIDADVDTHTEPWTLHRVTSTVAQAVTADPVLRHVTPLRIGDRVPGTPFVDQRGAPFSFDALRGEDVVLAFIYTRCQDARMCPLISAKFHALQSLAARRKVHLVEVTLDPAYDRPAVLARYATTFGADPARWTLAVGDADATLDFAARFGITTFPDPAIGIIHAENTVLIGADGTIDEMITDTSWTPDEIIAQLDAQHGRASNPIARFNLWLSKAATAVCGNDIGQFSGLRDLIVVGAIIGAMGYLARRLYRAIFIQNI